jgi:hypothetical protein
MSENKNTKDLDRKTAILRIAIGVALIVVPLLVILVMVFLR